jgi:hypothetical protein
VLRRYASVTTDAPLIQPKSRRADVLRSRDFWGLLAMRIVFTLMGGVQLLRYRRFCSRAARVPWVVADLRQGVSAISGDLYYPVLEFTTRDGRHVRAPMRLGTKPALAQVGDQVTVAYDPLNPEEAEIEDKAWVQVALLWLFVLLGMVCVTIALVWQ